MPFGMRTRGGPRYNVSCSRRDHLVRQASANRILQISGRKRCGLSAAKGWWECTERAKSDIYNCLVLCAALRLCCLNEVNDNRMTSINVQMISWWTYWRREQSGGVGTGPEAGMMGRSVEWQVRAGEVRRWGWTWWRGTLRTQAAAFTVAAAAAAWRRCWWHIRHSVHTCHSNQYKLLTATITEYINFIKTSGYLIKYE